MRDARAFSDSTKQTRERAGDTKLGRRTQPYSMYGEDDDRRFGAPARSRIPY